jgi:hypothetical protein
MFPETPMQMCHFHQVQIIRKRITKKPKTDANKELKEIVYRLNRTHKECFEAELSRWFDKYKEYIQEKSISPS